MNDQLLVGVSEVDITPPVGLPMDGYMARAGLSRGIHDPLLAQVLVLDSHMRMAIVALDVLAISAGFSDGLRHSLANILYTSADAILICASHTHAGPSGLQNWFPLGGLSALNAHLIEMVQSRVEDAARDAIKSLVPTKLTYAIGQIEGMGMDRNQSLPAPSPFLTALCFTKLDGTPAAIVVHYACHPTVLGPQLDYSADFPGAARRRIQAHYPGTHSLYLNGAAGNISTRFSRRSQTFGEMERLGNLLGDCVIGLLESPQASDANLGSGCTVVDLPFRSLLSTSARSLQATGNLRIDQTRTEGAAIEVQIAQALRAFGGRTSQPASLCALKIGPWRLMGVPGEPFNELAAALRRTSQFALVVGTANDYLGYFPTQAAIERETYEALSSPYDARALALIETSLLKLL